jgi:chromosome segregation ATPase
MTELQQHQQQPCQPPLQQQESRPPQEQQPPSQPRYQSPAEAQQGQLHEAAQRYQPPQEALQEPATQGEPERREEEAPPPAKSVRQLLDEYKAELQGAAAETEATKQFGKDLDDLAKEYDGISAIVAKYRIAHQKFVDQMKPLARIQHDEMQSWCNDPDEIPEELRTALRNLRGSYAQRAETIKSALDDAKSAINRLKSPLDEAKSAEADAQATFERTKTFETTVNGWFTELTGLHKSAKGDLDARDYRLVFAYFLEAKEVWRSTRSYPGWSRPNASATSRTGSGWRRTKL